MERLLIVTDAWRPQTNGVVRTLEYLLPELAAHDIEATLLSPADFWTVPLPVYPEIGLALAFPGAVGRRMRAARPDYVHLVTEGPLGWMARRARLADRLRFTTSYHTRFPEYFSERTGLPAEPVRAALRRFHNSGNGCMVATPSLAAELRGRGFERVQLWTRGVDTGLFRPRAATRFQDLARPILLCVGRVAVEKNLPAFLGLTVPGTKVVVGDGPQLAELRTRYPDAVFTGPMAGEDLAAAYASADVFVFPSRTDTFGLVLLEAMASGLPIAAYPVTGPLDVVGGSGAGVLSEDLETAIHGAYGLSRQLCRAVAERYSWSRAASDFVANLRNGHVSAEPGTSFAA
jgi:glycosyltransferase involved in cell wall biosynthesis